MGYIYAFRYGSGQEFKIGVTANLNRRLKQLQTGSPRKLVLFRSIEHAHYKEGEKYLKRRLSANKLEGGEENFRVSDAELLDVLEAVRVHMEEEIPRRRRVEEYSKLESEAVMLPPSVGVKEAKERLLRIRQERDLLEPTRAELAAKYQALDEEEERLRVLVMDSIGAARGILDVATWETVDGRRRFDEEWLKADEPQLFEAHRTKFDALRFRKDHPKEHAAHMKVIRERLFRWIDSAASFNDEGIAEAMGADNGLEELPVRPL